ncbi:CAAX prenyl protease 1 homolog [Drosophila sulfurigaster albostrigata]|uniref:CAAX prenyl protease 1 homolog n=1 Tax=Drosophila sulfurigaster albostrigata TaxID=89887 RepID=UPI002D21D1A3|nr:CAAX prenyl protease 1 homolog [Drosophila sulfurigaster albostrigata]
MGGNSKMGGNSGYSLYQYPMQSQPMEILYTGIGFRMVPDALSLNDPVFLRHLLVLMCVVRNLFHMYLCWRQLRLSQWTKTVPRQMQATLTADDFRAARAEESFNVEQKLMSYLFDAIFSCIELYFGVLPFLWRAIITCYSIVDDLVWQSLAYVSLFSCYMMLRGLPQVFYTKLVLVTFYEVSDDKSIPLVGLLCSFTLLVVLLQVGLFPLTLVFLIIEEKGGTYFSLWIWGFLFVTTLIPLLVCNLYGMWCVGKRSKLPAGALSNALADVLKQFKFPSDRVYVLRTFQTVNETVFAFGCWCTKHVVILENLLFNQGRPESELHPDDVGRGLKDDQVVAYVAHQLSHWRYKHAWITFFLGHATLLIYLILFGTCYRHTVLYEAAGFPQNFYPPIIGYWLVYKYVMPLYLTITNWIVFYFMRRFEFIADAYTHKIGYSSAFISALLKLVIDNRVFPYVDPWYLMWHRMKPSPLQRIKHLLRLQNVNNV